LESWETGASLKALLERDPENPLRGEALAEAFDPGWYLRYVDVIFDRFEL
jgi:adenylosuccinate lyase